MPTFFEKYTDDEGNEQYREVEVTVDVFDDDAIRQAKAYKALLDEQVKTRQDKAKLKAQLEALAKEEEAPEPEKPAEVAPPVDPAEIAKQVLEAIKAEQQAESAKAQQITDLLAKHKLPESMRGVLTQVSDPESVALTLSQSQYSFEQPEKPDLLEHIKERTKLPQDNVPDAVRKLFAR